LGELGQQPSDTGSDDLSLISQGKKEQWLQRLNVFYFDIEDHRFWFNAAVYSSGMFPTGFDGEMFQWIFPSVH
jgi:hypothetical protein